LGFAPPLLRDKPKREPSAIEHPISKLLDEYLIDSALNEEQMMLIRFDGNYGLSLDGFTALGCSNATVPSAGAVGVETRWKYPAVAAGQLEGIESSFVGVADSNGGHMAEWRPDPSPMGTGQLRHRACWPACALSLGGCGFKLLPNLLVDPRIPRGQFSGVRHTCGQSPRTEAAKMYLPRPMGVEVE